MPAKARSPRKPQSRQALRPDAATAPPKPRGAGRRPSAVASTDQHIRILDAAAALFAQHGFAGASLRQIAQAAGLSHAMIRHLFGDKDALWEATADHLFAPIWAAMASALADVDAADPVQQMEAQVRACVRAAARAPSLAGFVMQAGLAGGAHYAALVEQRLRPLYALALAPYRKLAQAGYAADAPAHFVFLAATNAAINPFAQAANSKALAGLDLCDPTVADAYADALVAILKHGVLRGPPPQTHAYSTAGTAS